MNLKIIDLASHRNGIDGAPFHVTVFNDGESIKLAVLFETKRHCAVFDFEKLLTGNIRFAENSFRGDKFEPHLRKAIAEYQRSTNNSNAATTLTNQERADRCKQAINAYSGDDTYTSLVDFLADAFHWCHLNGHSLLAALDTAQMHFSAENRKPTNERTQP